MKKILSITIGIITSFTIALIASHSAQASGFAAGRIIDDAVFTNHNSMSASQIQSFLNSKVPSCDTWGAQPSEFGGGTRRQWAEARGYKAPFTCLRDYTEHGKSSAQIIYDVSQEFRINPQVLLVLLQKEQSLITDTWPTTTQYRTATGYGCPDTAPCDSQYFGLTNQLRWASRMFRAIMDASPTWYTPYVVGNNFIRYSPDASCGGGNVYIQNRATQALYNYTPYQPNQAALNAGWGTAPCGAYGNRNFYLYFSNWFGQPNGGQPSIPENVTISKSLEITPDGSDSLDQSYTATFTLRNKSSSAINVGWMLVSVRDSGNFNLDFPVKNVIIPGNSTYTYSATRTFEWTDSMRAFVNGNFAQNIGWSSSLLKTENGALRERTFRVGGDVTLIDGGIKINRNSNTDNFTATAKFINRTNQPRNIGWFLVSARTPYGENIDFPTQQITVPANGTATYSQTRRLDLSDMGNFTFFANLNDSSPGGRGWTQSYPMSNDKWTNRTASFKNGPSVIQTGSMEVNVDNKGKATASVTFTNQGNSREYLGWVIASTRAQNSTANFDFPPQELTLNAGETKKMIFTQQLVRGGDYTTTLVFNHPSGWSHTYAPVSRVSVEREAHFKAPYSVQQVGNPSVTKDGSRHTAKITLKNTSDATVNLGWLIIQMRDHQNVNYDFPGVQATLKPGETKTFSTSRTLPNKTYKISTTSNHPSYGWGNLIDNAEQLSGYVININ